MISTWLRPLDNLLVGAKGLGQGREVFRSAAFGVRLQKALYRFLERWVGHSFLRFVKEYRPFRQPRILSRLGQFCNHSWRAMQWGLDQIGLRIRHIVFLLQVDGVRMRIFGIQAQEKLFEFRSWLGSFLKQADLRKDNMAHCSTLSLRVLVVKRASKQFYPYLTMITNVLDKSSINNGVSYGRY